MPRRNVILPALADRAFSIAEARLLGVGRGQLRHDYFAHPFHGVYSEGLDDYALKDRCLSLLPAMNEHQAYSHGTAARRWTIPLPRFYAHTEPLHVMTRGDHAPMRRAGVVGWETAENTRILYSEGLPLAAPANVWTQLAVAGSTGERMPLTPEWLVAVGDFLVTGGRDADGRRLPPLCTPRELAAAARLRRGRRGAKALEWALSRIRSGADSPKESELRLGLVAQGLPEPETQFAVHTASGVRHADLGYRAERLLIEYQGDDHRVSRKRWLEDLTRTQLFEEAGFRVISVGDHDLAGDCRDLAARIRKLLRSHRA